MIYPVTSVNEYPEIDAKFTDGGYSKGKIGVEISIGSVKKSLECDITGVTD